MKANRKKNRGKSFSPTHDYINDAVAEFLKKGGKISTLEAADENFESFIRLKDSPSKADDYLRGV